MRTASKLGVAALLFVLSAVTPAWSAPPSAISNLTGITRSPSSSERSAIERYADYWSQRLGSSDPEAIGMARKRLREPLGSITATKIFRDAYSDALVDELRGVVQRDDAPMGSANALFIAGELGTEDGLRLILEHVNSTREERVAIRLVAAKAGRTALETGMSDELISARSVPRVLRDFGRAARNEESWFVLERQLEAILAADHDISSEVRNEVFDDVVERLAAGEQPSPMIKALRPALVSMRDEYINAPPSTQRALGQTIAPRLQAALDVAGRHWPDPQKDRDLRTAYVSTVDICENALRFIDSTLGSRIGDTSLKRSFTEQDRGAYDAEVQRIETIISQPPYK